MAFDLKMNGTQLNSTSQYQRNQLLYEAPGYSLMPETTPPVYDDNGVEVEPGYIRGNATVYLEGESSQPSAAHGDTLLLFLFPRKIGETSSVIAQYENELLRYDFSNAIGGSWWHSHTHGFQDLSKDPKSLQYLVFDHDSHPPMRGNGNNDWGLISWFQEKIGLNPSSSVRNPSNGIIRLEIPYFRRSGDRVAGFYILGLVIREDNVNLVTETQKHTLTNAEFMNVMPPNHVLASTYEYKFDIDKYYLNDYTSVKLAPAFHDPRDTECSFAVELSSNRNSAYDFSDGLCEMSPNFIYCDFYKEPGVYEGVQNLIGTLDPSLNRRDVVEKIIDFTKNYPSIWSYAKEGEGLTSDQTADYQLIRKISDTEKGRKFFGREWRAYYRVKLPTYPEHNNQAAGLLYCNLGPRRLNEATNEFEYVTPYEPGVPFNLGTDSDVPSWQSRYIRYNSFRGVLAEKFPLFGARIIPVPGSFQDTNESPYSNDKMRAYTPQLMVQLPQEVLDNRINIVSIKGRNLNFIRPIGVGFMSDGTPRWRDESFFWPFSDASKNTSENPKYLKIQLPDHLSNLIIYDNDYYGDAEPSIKDDKGNWVRGKYHWPTNYNAESMATIDIEYEYDSLPTSEIITAKRNKFGESDLFSMHQEPWPDKKYIVRLWGMPEGFYGRKGIFASFGNYEKGTEVPVRFDSQLEVVEYFDAEKSRWALSYRFPLENEDEEFYKYNTFSSFGDLSGPQYTIQNAYNVLIGWDATDIVLHETFNYDDSYLGVEGNWYVTNYGAVPDMQNDVSSFTIGLKNRRIFPVVPDELPGASKTLGPVHKFDFFGDGITDQNRNQVVSLSESEVAEKFGAKTPLVNLNVWNSKEWGKAGFIRATQLSKSQLSLETGLKPPFFTVEKNESRFALYGDGNDAKTKSVVSFRISPIEGKDYSGTTNLGLEIKVGTASLGVRTVNIANGTFDAFNLVYSIDTDGKRDQDIDITVDVALSDGKSFTALPFYTFNDLADEKYASDKTTALTFEGVEFMDEYFKGTEYFFESGYFQKLKIKIKGDDSNIRDDIKSVQIFDQIDLRVDVWATTFFMGRFEGGQSHEVEVPVLAYQLRSDGGRVFHEKRSFKYRVIYYDDTTYISDEVFTWDPLRTVKDSVSFSLDTIEAINANIHDDNIERSISFDLAGKSSNVRSDVTQIGVLAETNGSLTPIWEVSADGNGVMQVDETKSYDINNLGFYISPSEKGKEFTLQAYLSYATPPNEVQDLPGLQATAYVKSSKENVGSWNDNALIGGTGSLKINSFSALSKSGAMLSRTFNFEVKGGAGNTRTDLTEIRVNGNKIDNITIPQPFDDNQSIVFPVTVNVSSTKTPLTFYATFVYGGDSETDQFGNITFDELAERNKTESVVVYVNGFSDRTTRNGKNYRTFNLRIAGSAANARKDLIGISFKAGNAFHTAVLVRDHDQYGFFGKDSGFLESVELELPDGFEGDIMYQLGFTDQPSHSDWKKAFYFSEFQQNLDDTLSIDSEYTGTVDGSGYIYKLTIEGNANNKRRTANTIDFKLGNRNVGTFSLSEPAKLDENFSETLDIVVLPNVSLTEPEKLTYRVNYAEGAEATAWKDGGTIDTYNEVSNPSEVVDITSFTFDHSVVNDARSSDKIQVKLTPTSRRLDFGKVTAIKYLGAKTDAGFSDISKWRLLDEKVPTKDSNGAYEELTFDLSYQPAIEKGFIVLVYQYQATDKKSNSMKQIGYSTISGNDVTFIEFPDSSEVIDIKPLKPSARTVLIDDDMVRVEVTVDPPPDGFPVDAKFLLLYEKDINGNYVMTASSTINNGQSEKIVISRDYTR